MLGYSLKLLQDYKHLQLEEDFYFKFKNFRILSSSFKHKVKKKPNLYLIHNNSVLLNSNINSAIQEIFDIILVNYINNWYLAISNNEDFIVEIKYFFHTICAEILLRFSKADIPALFANKCMPAIINHLEICYLVQHCNNETVNAITPVQELLLQKMKSHLHIAMIGRGEEVAYLKSVSKFLIPNLCPDYISQTELKICLHLLQECLVGTVLLPAMDSLASPDFINKIICLILEPTADNSSSLPLQPPTYVPILHRYQTTWIDRLKAQKGHPKGIESFLRNDKYLYHFLRFIKSIDAISPINFFMLMDSITMSLLNPDLDEATKINLFEDLERLEDLMKSADDYSDLNISSNLHDRVKEIIAGGYKKVDQLKNCKIWLENYNAICQHTESLYLSQYLESEFYLATIYGNRQADIDPSEKLKDSSLSFEDSTKHFNCEDSMDSFNWNGDGNNDDQSVNMGSDNSIGFPFDLPDLSNLRVKIPSISQLGPNPKSKNELCFTVCTYRVDSDKLEYKVHRKYGEFYVLEQKLIEFHGNVGRALPPKRPWDTKKLDFLDNCKYEFETYLLFLVNRSFLKNSQLLFSFLKSNYEFNINTLIDINIGRMVKAMPLKLAKEKGQFLDQFLNYFHVSCESSGHTKSTSSNEPNNLPTTNVTDLHTKSIIDKQMHSRMFWNNAELINTKCGNFMDEVCQYSTRSILYFYDVVCHFYEKITEHFLYSHLILTVLYRIRPLFVDLFQKYVTNIIKNGIQKLCSDKVAVDIIHILRDAILMSGTTRSVAEKLKRRDQASNCLYHLIPELCSLVLPPNYTQSMCTEIDHIFDCLQQPKLNKQLSYVLFDILLLELFPELSDDDLAHIETEVLTPK